MIPTAPGACSSVEESVATSAQPVGSGVPAFHTRTRSVVGEVPVARALTYRASPVA